MLKKSLFVSEFGHCRSGNILKQSYNESCYVFQQWCRQDLLQGGAKVEIVMGHSVSRWTSGRRVAAAR